MDAVAHGIAAALAPAGARLRIFPADLRGGQAAIATGQARSIEAALGDSVAAIILLLDMSEPEAATAAALARGVPIVTIHKPSFPVSASLMVPNYHQGVVLAQALGRAIGNAHPARATPARVAILGGPAILDDIELVRGAVDGVLGSHLTLVNDPFLPQYRNLDDVRGGYVAWSQRVPHRQLEVVGG
jgi:hypothetical protein